MMGQLRATLHFHATYKQAPHVYCSQGSKTPAAWVFVRAVNALLTDNML
jgi:hypothetical protein